MINNRQWLPHIINSIPKNVRGYSLSAYCTILEAWRRGITVTFINKNRRKSELFYTLSYNGRSHLFTVAKGDLVTKEAMNICKNKYLTKKYLQKDDVPVPQGKKFTKEINDTEIIEYAQEIGYPVVIKPFDGTGGKGVIANIKNKEGFIKALHYVRYDLNLLEVIVEKHVEGEDYRVYVIDGNVIGAIKRIPANVIGDGKSTIRELIEDKQKERNKNPSLIGRTIKLDEELFNMVKQQGYTMKSIPAKDEQVVLKTKNNVSAGGDSIDITDCLTREIKDIAINATKSIPGLIQCGVDIIVDEKNNKGYIIELNSMPHITAQLFPMKGKARDIPKAIIDYYFPETKQNDYASSYYFDFESVWQSFREGSVNKISLPNAPKGDIVATRFIVSGKVVRVHYGAWIRRQANLLDLNGYVKLQESGEVIIVVSGALSAVNKFRELISTQGSKSSNVTSIIEKVRKTPVKVGFEIMNGELDRKLKDGYYPVRVKGIKTNINKEKSGKSTQKKPIVKKDNYYKKEYDKVINSTSWKITKPLRMLGKMVKGK